MNTNTIRLQDRLSEIKALLDGLYAQEAHNELETCRANCHQLLLDGTALTTSDTSPENKREVIAGMHMAVKRIQDAADEVATKTAEAYRKELGSGKDEFERLSSELQQRQNPAAYRCLTAFHQAQALLDQLGSLNSALLDTSSIIEQAARPASPETLGTAPKYDSDPAPSSLSP